MAEAHKLDVIVQGHDRASATIKTIKGNVTGMAKSLAGAMLGVQALSMAMSGMQQYITESIKNFYAFEKAIPSMPCIPST